MADRVRRTLTLNDLRFLGDLLLGKPRVSGMSPLHGGMINEVVEIQLGDEPYRAVVKVSYGDGDPFGKEEEQLRFLNETKLLPCPMPYIKGVKGEHAPFAFLMIERLSGMNLGQADLRPADAAKIETDLAQRLGRLHERTGDKFGFWGDETHESWLEVFEPMVLRNRAECERKLDPTWLRKIDILIERMPGAFEIGPKPEPRLVHGDVWSANIIVSMEMGQWRIQGLVDPGLAYADVEYELAYLECFKATGSSFFNEYATIRPMRDGYELRKRYYWLNTMLLHVHLFGDEGYVRHTRRIIDELEQEWRYVK